MPDNQLGLSVFIPTGIVTNVPPLPDNLYRQPDGVSLYFQPDGTSYYLQP